MCVSLLRLIYSLTIVPFFLVKFFDSLHREPDVSESTYERPLSFTMFIRNGNDLNNKHCFDNNSKTLTIHLQKPILFFHDTHIYN